MAVSSAGGPEVAGWGSDAQMWLFHSIPCGTQPKTSFTDFSAAINYLNTYLLKLFFKLGF